jgi:hypothetical protein
MFSEKNVRYLYDWQDVKKQQEVFVSKIYPEKIVCIRAEHRMDKRCFMLSSPSYIIKCREFIEPSEWRNLKIVSREYQISSV